MIHVVKEDELGKQEMEVQRDLFSLSFPHLALSACTILKELVTRYTDFKLTPPV